MPIVHSVKIIPIYLHLFEWSNISLIVLCLKSVWWLMAVVVVACQSLFCLQEDCDKTQVPPPNNWSCLSPLHPWSLIISLQSNVYYFICDHFAFFFFVRPSFHLFPESILFPPFFTNLSFLFPHATKKINSWNCSSYCLLCFCHSLFPCDFVRLSVSSPFF
jgi:hypothetical protein